MWKIIVALLFFSALGYVSANELEIEEIEGYLPVHAQSCPSEELCPPWSGFCDYLFLNSPTCICWTLTQYRDDCTSFLIDEYKEMYLLVVINIIFWVFLMINTALTLIFRVTHDKWQFNVSNNCYIVLFVLALVCFLESTTFFGKYWPSPVYWYAFWVLYEYLQIILIILIVDFWYHLTVTFSRPKKYTSTWETLKTKIVAIVVALLLIPYDIQSWAYLHDGEVFRRSASDKAAMDIFFFFAAIVYVVTISIVMRYGISVVIYFRKNNLSGNLPVARMTVLCILLCGASILQTLTILFPMEPEYWTIGPTFIKFRVYWVLHVTRFLQSFAIFVTLRGGNVFDIFKPGTWKSKSDDVSNAVNSTTVTVPPVSSTTANTSATATSTVSAMDSTTAADD